MATRSSRLIDKYGFRKQKYDFGNSFWHKPRVDEIQNSLSRMLRVQSQLACDICSKISTFNPELPFYYGVT